MFAKLVQEDKNVSKINISTYESKLDCRKLGTEAWIEMT